MKIKPQLILFITIMFPLWSLAQLNIIQYQLSNGLTVILNPDQTQNKVAASVAINTGSKNDPTDATGISHYLEHLLFKGTTELGTIDYDKEKPYLDSINYYYDKLGKTNEDEERKSIQQKINVFSIKASQYSMPNEFDKLLKSIGSTEVNATTSNDLTIYYNTIPPHQINKWLDIYAHRFINPVFRSFQSELEVVYEEKNRAMDNMQRRVLETFGEEFYKGHPYGEKNTLGSVEHLKNPSLTKMYNYFQEYYVANNMALIICGDINVDEIKPLIEKTFGKLKKGTVPQNNIQPPRPFEGREVKKMRMTPIKAGIMGYRTAERFHHDEIALEAISYLFSNEAGTGLIDELKNDNQLMEAFAFPEVSDEAGQQVFVFLPKIIGQSLKKAEKLILNKIDRLKTGDFPDDLLSSVKNEMYKDFQVQIENINNRGWLLSNCFRKGKKWEDIANYPKEVENLSKENIVKVAQKYFTEDYFVLQTRTGFPKKEKLEKPNFKAGKIDQSKESSYAKYFNSLESGKVQNKFIDFKKDLSITKLGAKSTLYVVNNPVNDIYELRIQFHIGTLSKSNLSVLAELMNYAHPKAQTLSTFKKELSTIGSLYSFYTGASYFTLKLSGIERDLELVLEKIDNLISTTEIDDNSIKTVINTYKTDRKVDKESPLLIARAMAQYSIYGDQSPLLNRPGLNEIKKMSGAQFSKDLELVKKHAVNVHFSGKTSTEELQQLLNEKLSLNWDGESKLATSIDITDEKKNKVLLIDNKKMIQSHIFFIKPSTLFEINQYPKIRLFNAYFGGGFSGILKQEIREYRSLAYTSSARYLYTSHPKTKNYFFTYIGCQADKTNEAAEVAYNLITEMPKKEDRMDLIRNNVQLKQQSEYPSFRSLSSTVEAYLYKGLSHDPNEYAIQQYEHLQFKDIIDFYTNYIQNTPTFLNIYGDMKRIDKAKLEKIGEVKEIEKERVINF